MSKGGTNFAKQQYWSIQKMSFSMNGNFKRFILTALSSFVLCIAAWGQSRFVYIQSENGQPFYLKMKDSLMSSTQAGYLILPQLKKGTYAVVVGFAKKKVPEAAFKITIGDSGDKGYMLDANAGKLRLVNIQNKEILPPEEIATSAGNRILPSTLGDLSEKPSKKKDTVPKLTVSKSKVSVVPEQGDKPGQELKKETQLNTFEAMLNAVTGGSLASSSETTETSPSEEKELSSIEKEVDEKPSKTREENDSDLAPHNNEKKYAVTEDSSKLASVAKDDDESSAFEKLLNVGEGSNEEKGKEVHEIPKDTNLPISQPEKDRTPVAVEPEEKKNNLVFIDFKDEAGKKQVDSVISGDTLNAKDNLEKVDTERQKKRIRKRMSFDELLAKIDTTADTSSRSVARPLLSDDKDDGGSPSVNENMVCNVVADQQYFEKVRRKVASKKGGSSMLRTALHHFSDGKCFTVSQLKQMAYLFSTDEYRIQFLKAAYQHCSDKEHFGELLETLSSKKYQDKLRNYIH